MKFTRSERRHLIKVFTACFAVSFTVSATITVLLEKLS